MKIKLFLILNTFFFISLQLQAQVTASFTADPMQGCAPLQVNFTNTSTGTGTLTYLWTFGNGNSSIQQNPSPQTYSNPGTYNITLQVSNGTQTQSVSQTIVVSAPTPLFTADVLSGCDQLTVQFTDQSVSDPAAITNWQWDFGDGGGSSQQNPSHTYSSPGVYTVFLRVTDAGGCHSDLTKTNYIIVSQSPNSNFSADITNYCSAPITINFSYTPQTTGNFSFAWTFGDGGTANSQNPSHLYDTIGLYDVSLTVTDQYGCTSNSSINDYINLTSVNASFTILEGDSVCPNQYIHLNNTSGVSGVWYYPDGSTSNIDSVYYYNAGNPFTTSISFIAAYGSECADTVSKQIVVTSPPIANFNIDEPYGCQIPHNVQFSSQSAEAVSWLWTFFDGDSSIIENPTHSFLTQGTFYIMLTITNQKGCKGSLQKEIFINFPIANFTNDTNLGCIPVPITFTDASTCNTTYDAITGWQWDFGQGTPSTSTQQNPTHNYTTDGDFQVHLTITTQHGCSVSDSMIVNIGSHQNLDFTIDPLISCAQDTITVTNLSQDTTKIDTYSWTFGPALTSNLQNPIPFVLKNTVDTGWAYFTLITNYNGCQDTLVDSAYVKGPIIKTMEIITSMMNCGYDSSYVYYLTTNTQGAEYWKWNWRDSSAIDSVTIDTLRHQYGSSGNRTVTIWAYNDITGCIYKDSIIVRPRDIHANLQFEDTMCFNINAFNGLPLKDAVEWSWNFGDGTPTTTWTTSQLSSHIFDTTGYYLVWMYARTDNELQCVDSTSKYVRIFKPEVEFYADTLIGCAQSPIIIPFHSISFSPDTNIVDWVWNLGDGQTSSDTAFSHAYPTPGKYSISLQVTDGYGCINTLTKNDYIASLAVTADFITPQVVYCTNEDIPFMSTSTAIPPDYPPIHFNWFFGNGDSSYLASPVHPYPIKGTYDVMLVISDTLGCYDTIIKTDYIEAQTIIASFTSDTSSTCYPFIPTIVNNTLTEFNPIFNWSFGDGATSNDTVPIHAYTLPDYYYLVLEAATSHGCQDRDSVRIHVGGPLANISLDQTQICKGDSITFNITDSVSVQTYSWDFGDGTGVANISPASHGYNYVPVGGFFNVSLFYNSPLGDCPKVADTTIYLYQVVANCALLQSGINDSTGCNPLPVSVSDNSTGATNWSWDLGDGTTFNGQNPGLHTYTNSSQSNQIFNLSLIISNNIGCSDTAFRKIIVYPTPTFSLLYDTILCVGSNLVLLSSGGNSILWTSDSTLNGTTLYNPTVAPTNTTTYAATISSGYGCLNSDSVKVTVQQTPDLTTSVDTTIIIGEYLDLFASSTQQNVSFQWSPSPNDNSITCMNCPEPTVRPLKNTDYSIRVADSVGCFSLEKIVHVIVDNRFSVDVPTVFTPNDDGHNDLIFPKGWGVDKLKLFQIYNRWGQIIFETDDINTGWNGMFNGKIQPSDTYSYFVEMIMLDGSSKTKKGTFNLLR